MPIGEGLETALHPKPHRKRMRRSRSPPILAASPKYSPEKDVESKNAVCANVAPESPAAAMPPSPIMFVECGQSAPTTPPSSPRKRSRRSLLISNNHENFGSDESSDGSDNEMVSSFIPRAFRSMLETPVDEEAVEPTIVLETSTDSTSTAVDDVVSAETYRPHSFYEFDWDTFPDPPIQPELRRETFSESTGPTIPHDNPYDIFIAIWDRQFMEYIASETNRYAQQVAQQMMDDNTLQPNSRISQWVDTTADELYVYFGIVIAMGVVVKSRIEEYWSSSADIFCTPGFAAHMSINRFLLLSKYIHFNNNEDMCASELAASEAKLFKIKPLLSHLNNKFQSFYKLAQNISLDESLLQWKGWLDINQIVPNKVAGMGIKSYEICESQTGYLWRFEIHARKKSPQQPPEEPLNTSTSSIVLRLTHGLENKGHTLWMDNYYNSPSLARRLKASGIDCVGTLRTNRKFVPHELQNLTKTDMRRGQIAGLTSGDVDVMVWRDNNRVAMISTYHGNTVKRVQNSIKPTLILDYNIMMGGVDKKDQLLAMYPIERKRTRVWYKKLFRRLLNISVLNSYIIHHHSFSLTHRNFRIALVRSLLFNHSSTAPRFPPRPIAPTSKPTDLTHRLAEYPMQDSGYRKRRLCKVCKKRVHTFCVGCCKTVCIDPCFVHLHA